MKVVRSEHTVFVDVDGTLILPFNHNAAQQVGKVVGVWDPLTNKHLDMVAHIVVWSRGGYEWAEAVVVALGLTPHIDTIMSKPMVYFDDMDIQNWLPYRVFLEPTMQYKK